MAVPTVPFAWVSCAASAEMVRLVPDAACESREDAESSELDAADVCVLSEDCVEEINAEVDLRDAAICIPAFWVVAMDCRALAVCLGTDERVASRSSTTDSNMAMFRRTVVMSLTTALLVDEVFAESDSAPLLMVDATTRLTAATKALLTSRSTVVAPVSVTLAAMPLIFSLT